MFDAQYNLLYAFLAKAGILRSDLLITILLIVLVLLVLLISSRNQRWTVPGR